MAQRRFNLIGRDIPICISNQIISRPFLKVTHFSRKDVFFMATKAKRLPSGNWRSQVLYTDSDGKRHFQSFTASTKKEAEYLAADFEMEKERLSDCRNWTLGETIDEYIRLKRPILSPSTIQGYEKVRNHNFQSLMDIPIRKITAEMMQEAVKKEIERKPQNRSSSTLSVKSVKNAYGVVNASITRFNPRIDYSIEFPKQPRKIRRTLPLPEEIFAAVKGSKIELAVLLAVWLSFTESEIRGLTKSKSIDGDYITIREVVVVINGVDTRKEMAKEVTRNRRHRIPPYIKELINQVDGDILVPYVPSVLLRNLKRLLRNAGLPEITFHDLRHINATLMMSLGIPESMAMERGGWKTDYVMKSVYVETLSGERELADRTIDSYFERFIH